MPNAAPKNSRTTLPALLERVRAGEDVLLSAPGDAGRAMLDEAAVALHGEFRTVRVSARDPGLSLTGLMAQLAGTDPAAQDDAVLELGYQILAVPDAPGGRIVWLIDGADLLQRPALRYVQHMVRSARALILVVAAGPAFPALLEGDDFAGLRDRLFGLPAAPEQALVPMRPELSMVETRRVGPFLLIAGLGMAASVALGAWAARTQWNPSPVTVAAVQAPAARPAPQVAVAPPAPAPAAPVVVAAAAQPQIALPTPAISAPQTPPSPPPADAGHDRARLALAPTLSEPGHARRTRHETHGREIAAGPRRAQPARLTGNPAPAYGRGWDEPSPDWADAAPPAPNWQPRAYGGYAGGYEPPNGYIGTLSTDRYGYRIFRYDP